MKVAIVGGGICGLALALYLKPRGIAYRATQLNHLNAAKH